jgi:hypothetical protein
MKISLLVSSRGRPAILKNMWHTANVNRCPAEVTDQNGYLNIDYKHDIELILCLDEDDTDSIKLYYDSLVSYNTRILIGPRPTILGETTNRCFKESSGEICMLCTDDVIFHTQNWDDLVVQEFLKYPDRIVLVHGEDGIQHGKTATLPFLHRNWIKTIGRYLPTYFINQSGDRWLTNVADKIGRRVYLPNLFIEHLHPVHGTMPMDATYQERIEMRRKSGTSQHWRRVYASLDKEREVEAERLRKFIAECK